MKPGRQLGLFADVRLRRPSGRGRCRTITTTTCRLQTAPQALVSDMIAPTLLPHERIRCTACTCAVAVASTCTLAAIIGSGGGWRRRRERRVQRFTRSLSTQSAP